jgi:hypothetical protein
LRLRERLADIERTDNRVVKRDVIEKLVSGVTVVTEPARPYHRKEYTLNIAYRLSPEHAVDDTTNRRASSQCMGLTDQLKGIPWTRFRAVLHWVGTYSMRVTRPE